MKKPDYYVLYVVFILWVVNIFNYIDRISLSVLLPSIKSDLHLSDGELGLLVGFAFSLFYSLCGIPIARLADRSNRKNLIAVALAGWSLATALTGAANNFWQLFLMRIGVGVGEAGCLPPAQSLICDYVPLRHRAAVLAFHSFGLTVGMAVGISCAGFLADRVGWRAAFLLLGLPGVVLAVLVATTLREPRRGILDDRSDFPPASSFVGSISTLVRNRTYVFLLVFFGSSGFTQYSLIQWWPSFFWRSHHLTASAIGPSLGFAIGLGTGAGTLIGGVLSSRSTASSPAIALRLTAAFAAVSLPLTFASLVVNSSDFSIVLVGAAAVAWGVGNGPVLGAIYSVAPPSLRATAGALPILFASIFGFGLGPVIVGVTSDILAPSMGPMSLQYALMVPLSAIPVSTMLLWLASRSVAKDLSMDQQATVQP